MRSWPPQWRGSERDAPAVRITWCRHDPPPKTFTKREAVKPMARDEKAFRAACEALDTRCRPYISRHWNACGTATTSISSTSRKSTNGHAAVGMRSSLTGITSRAPWSRIVEWRNLESDAPVVGDAAIVYSLLMTSIQLKDVEQTLAGEVRLPTDYVGRQRGGVLFTVMSRVGRSSIRRLPTDPSRGIGVSEDCRAVSIVP